MQSNTIQSATVEPGQYVVMRGERPYYSTLGIYDAFRADNHRQWNPIHDGFRFEMELSAIPSIEEAIRECDAAHERQEAWSALPAYVVALPIRVNPDTGRFDPELTRVYTGGQMIHAG